MDRDSVIELAVPLAKSWLYDTINGMVDDEMETLITAQVHPTPIHPPRITFHIRIPRADMGKIVGKKGRNAKALRALLFARSGKDKASYILDIQPRRHEFISDELMTINSPNAEYQGDDRDGIHQPQIA